MLLMHGLPGLRPRHTWPEYSAYRRLGTTQSSLVLACNDFPSTLQLTRRCCHFVPDLPLITAQFQYTPRKSENPALCKAAHSRTETFRLIIRLHEKCLEGATQQVKADGVTQTSAVWTTSEQQPKHSALQRFIAKDEAN